MKIEVTCAHCNSLLRVDAMHAGKQMRCPTCNNLSPIPEIDTSVEDETGFNDEAGGGNASFRKAGFEDDRFSRPPADVEQPQPAFLNSTMTAARSGSSEALVIGILGIVLNFGCGCLFPVWFVLNLFGLYLAIRHGDKYKKAGIVTNVIALAISGFWLLRMLWS